MKFKELWKSTQVALFRALFAVVASLLVVAALVALAAILKPVEQRRNLNLLLSGAEPLPRPGGKGDLLLSASIRRRRGPLLALVSPDRRRWHMLHREENRLTLQSQDRRRVVQLATAKLAPELQLYVAGRKLCFYSPGNRPASIKIPPDWQLWPLGSKDRSGAPLWKLTRFHSELKRDDFMREKFGSGDGWVAEQGTFRTLDRGGDDPRSMSVNAFVLEAKAGPGEIATARTGWEACANYTVQINARPVTPETSYYLEAGNQGQARLAFGWNAAEKHWQLVFRFSAGDESVLDRQCHTLPPGNWTRFGLSLETPFKAVPLLDGVALKPVWLAQPVYGQVRLRVEGGAAHFDDFCLRTHDIPPPRHTPLRVKSKAFAKKPTDEYHKDADFLKWAEDTLCYKKVRIDVDGQKRHALRFNVPLYGDFTYEGRPVTINRLLIRLEGERGEQSDFLFCRKDGEWYPGGDNSQEPPPNSDATTSRPPLRLCYEDGALYLERSPRILAGRVAIEAPLYFTVCAFTRFVRVKEHLVRSANLWDELFEQAPSGWCWWCGEFGVQSRWACQPYWNWMGGSSRNLAACFSRAAYQGDQTIEYYVSLLDVIHGGKDKGGRRYVRKNLNFSFCTDGRDVSSGYSVLYGGFDNSGLYLMKGRRVLASKKTVRFPEFVDRCTDIHWRWWHFRIEKKGRRICVFVDERKIFDVVDDDGLGGGHLAFWTVRNGFLLARVRVAAERREWRAERFWYEPTDKVKNWEPLEPGCVRLVKSRDMTRVVNRIGGGTFAVRWVGGPIDLARRPVLRMPLEVRPGAMVNLHIQVSGRGYLIPVTATVEDTSAVLCPAWQAAPHEQAFYRAARNQRLPSNRILPPVLIQGGYITVNLLEALGERAGASPIVESLIVGNTSNKGYLLAGFAGNSPGAEYLVGTPAWLPGPTR